MTPVVVVLENSRQRKVLGSRMSAPEMASWLAAWAASAEKAARESGVCKSFIVSFHVGDCDHEVEP